MELRMFDLSISLSKVSVKFQKKMRRRVCKIVLQYVIDVCSPQLSSTCR
jgi:hypothetical protein